MYKIEELGEDDDDGTMPGNVDTLAEAVVGRKIVSAEVRSPVEEMKCPGSGQSPDRKPDFYDHGKLPCPVCGVRTPVYLRRVDWSLPSHLYFGDHE